MFQADATSGQAVIVHRFATQLDADGNTVVEPLTDGVLILRYLFDSTGESFTAGAVGDGCSRCDAETIIEYLDTLANGSARCTAPGLRQPTRGWHAR